MNEKPTAYDIILFGSDLQDPELQDTINKLALMFKATPEQARLLLATKGNVVAKGVATERAQQIRDKLLAIGVNATLRPHVQSVLDGVGIAAVEKVFECPACGRKYALAEGETEPEVCANPNCQVVFAKYSKVMAEKAERERIRKSLAGQQQAKLEMERKQREKEEAEARRRRIEDEIRAELGLPKLINSRGRLLGSAVAVNLLGVVLGVGGIYAYDSMTGSNAPSMPGSVGGNAVAGSNHTNPGIMAQEAIGKLLATTDTDTETGAGTGTKTGNGAGDGIQALGGSELLGVDYGTLPSSSASDNAVVASSASTSTSSMAFLDSILASFKTDTEWDQYLLTKADALLIKGNTADAIQLIGQVQGVELRFNRGARLMVQLWNRNQGAEATTLYQNLTAAGERLTGGPAPRVTALCTIARYLNAAGRKAETEVILQKVRMLADTIIEPADKAIANSETAALFTILGHAEDARELFSSAVRLLSDIPDPIKQLNTLASLAPGYAKAGYRASALQLLEDAIRKGSALPETPERSMAIGHLAEVSAQLADMAMALNAVRRIADATVRDQTLYQILTQETLADRLAQATDLAKYLKTPTYQALASGFLGLSQQEQPAYRGLAAASAQQARTAVYAIGPIGERAAVMSELGRFAARSGDTTQSDQYFNDSKRIAGSLTDEAERNHTLAVLAANKAQALHFTEAKQDLAYVTDVGVRDLVAVNINNWQQAANIGL